MSIIGAFIMPHPPLIIPQIGRGEEKIISKTVDACNLIARRIAELKPDTIVLTSPHSIMYQDYIHISPGQGAKGTFEQFGQPSVGMDVKYDESFVNLLCHKAEQADIPAGTLGERSKTLDHGTMIPLSFVNTAYNSYELVRIGLSGLPPVVHYQFGKLIKECAEELERRVIFIASGDLSHKLLKEGPYGFAKEGPLFDKEVTEAMDKGDFLKFISFSEDFCDAAAECGLRSFQIMAGALDKCSVKSKLLSYEGPFGVGYGVAAFEVTGEDPDRNFDEIFEQNEVEKATGQSGDSYVQLARYSLETYIKTGKHASLPDNLPSEMLERKTGVFVSLKKYGQLRGCIGTIYPSTNSIAEEILQNAVSAGCEDPRFNPVRENELDKLIYSVDVLGKPEPIKDKSELDVKKYGVIVTNEYRRGLLLPNLEGVDTVEQQIEIARQKAGIKPGEEIGLQRFEVIRHK